MTTEQMDWLDEHHPGWLKGDWSSPTATPDDRFIPPRRPRRRIRPFFRWYDLWVGAYWDRHSRTLYVCPLPMIGVAIGGSGE